MPSSAPPAVRIRQLSKCYELYNTPRDRLKQFVLPRLQKWMRRVPTRYFREFWALNDATFEIRKGETVGIIGRNGSGKSTLLQMICGTLTPTRGSVEVHGRLAALLELGSGFNPEFTGRENVYLNAAILGLSSQEIDARFDSIAAFADIGEFMSQPIKTYSSGMVVRLAFATAIHADPDILVVDEALSVGDTAFQQKCLSRIRQLQREGVTILLVTHSTNTLVEYCDRGIYLKNGRQMADGACRDVVKLYADDLVRDEGGLTQGMAPGVLETEPLDTSSASTPHDKGALPACAPAGAPMRIVNVTLCDDSGLARSTVEHGQVIRVVVHLQLYRPVSDPCFGIQLSSPDGITLWSASTQSITSDLTPMHEGSYQFTWELRATFSGNRYVVAIGAGEIVNGEYKRHHRLDYAGHFDVIPLPRAGTGWLAPMPVFQCPMPHGA